MGRTLLFIMLGFLAFVPAIVAQQTAAPVAPSKEAIKPSDEKQDVERSKVPVATLSEEELEKLLSTRLGGELGNSFRQFSNMFLVKSRIQLGMGIGLMSNSKKVANAPLQPVYPDSYQPTLREFLDAIGLQTSSNWKYDKTNQFVSSDAEVKDPVKELAIFEFVPVEKKRAKPYEVELAKGWKAIDNGHWVMHVPPTFPIGLDVYEMGVYTSDKPDKTKFYQKIRTDVSLQWAKRVSPNAKASDFVKAKIGEYEALHFTAMIPSQLNKDIKWRQWVFMADNRCYFIVSTILPEKDQEIFPDVEKILATFKSKPNKEIKSSE